MPEEQVSPHTVIGTHSALSDLIAKAFNLWGINHAETVDGTTIQMFLTFANIVVEDINSHPYTENNTPLDYYEDVREVKAVPDNIIIFGMLAHYAEQQASDRLQIYRPTYYKVLNQHLWNRLNGNTPIELAPLDKRSGRSVINGREA